MKALVFGTRPQHFDVPPGAGRLLRNLGVTPCALEEVADAVPLRPDWYVVRPVRTGICGSDSKQILLDFDGDTDSAMSGFATFPQVLGHEVVGVVHSAGPAAEGFDIGDRVVLNPWLTCVTRGVSPICPACEAGDLSLCWSFTEGDLSAGIHTGVSSDATGGYAELLPAHSSMLFPVPEALDDHAAVLADPFAVSLHSVTRHPPPRSGRVLVWGAGSLGASAIAILRTLFPEVEVGVVARFDSQADLAVRLGAHAEIRSAGSDNRAALDDAIAAWSRASTARPTWRFASVRTQCSARRAATTGLRWSRRSLRGREGCSGRPWRGSAVCRCVIRAGLTWCTTRLRNPRRWRWAFGCSGRTAPS